MPKVFEKILVVDDDPDTLSFVKQTLEKLDYKVTTAETGETGLEKLTEEKPDMVILDVLLPGIDGWKVLEKVKSAGGEAPPVILLTVKGQNKDKLRGYTIGAEYYLSKPFSMQALIQAVETVVKEHAK